MDGSPIDFAVAREFQADDCPKPVDMFENSSALYPPIFQWNIAMARLYKIEFMISSYEVSRS